MKGNPKMNDLFPSGPEIVKIMRENPNINKKDEILTYVYAVESDECEVGC